MIKIYLLPFIFLGLAAASLRGAETGMTERTLRQVLVESAGVGSDKRDRVEAVGRMVAGNETARAMREVEVLLVEFKKLMPEKETRYVSVSSDDQFAEFVGSNRGHKVVRVAWGLQKLLFLKAFILAEENPKAALPVLEELLRYAPYSSDARCERGYVQNLLGEYQAGLGSYQEALALAGRFASEKHNAPVAWRGCAYSLTRLGKLTEAEVAFKKSLEVEPESSVAHDGLAALAQMKREKTAKTASKPAENPRAQPAGGAGGAKVPEESEFALPEMPEEGR